MKTTIRVLLCLLVIVQSVAAWADDWPQFRGPLGNGICTETGVPLSWDREKNVRWRVELSEPGNNSSPIVSGDSVFIAVATDEGRRRSLQCHDRKTGKMRWVRTVTLEERELTHRTSPYASSTPVADGTRVVVWHSAGGMHCYDYDGKLLWSRDLGRFIHIWGYAASPIIHGDLVINHCGPGERQMLVALDKTSGQVVWKSEESGGTSGKKKPWNGSWSTPVVVRVDGTDQILLSFPHHVKAYEPTTGKVLWQCDGLDKLVYTSIVVGDGKAVAMGGFHGPAIGFRLGGSGNVTEKNQLWRVERNPQRVGSGLIVGEQMYMANERGTVECFDVSTGNKRWEDKLSDDDKKTILWSSLTLVEGRIYVSTQAGDTIVFAADPDKFNVLSVNPLGETINASLAISDGQIFLRTHKALYCIEEK